MTTKYGTSGNDNPLRGTAGNDSIYGLAGNDRIITDDGDDYVEAGDGDDEVNGYPTIGNAYSFWTSTGNKTIYGGNGNDFLLGGTGNNVIHGTLATTGYTDKMEKISFMAVMVTTPSIMTLRQQIWPSMIPLPVVTARIRSLSTLTM